MKKAATLFLFYCVLFYYNPQTIAHPITDWFLSYVAVYIPKTANASSDIISVLNAEDENKTKAAGEVKNIFTESGKECIRWGKCLNKAGAGILTGTFAITSAWDSLSPSCCTSYSELTPNQGYAPTYPIKVAGYAASTFLIGTGTAITVMGAYLKDTDNRINTPDTAAGNSEKVKIETDGDDKTDKKTD